jgi:Prolyl oligopeptidase, N-terminal beta-propeller domain
MFTFLLRSCRVLPVAAALGTAVHLPAETLTQPVAPVRPVTDNCFGTTVTDNYRWMEDLKSPEGQKWMKGQAAYTKDYLSKLPGRDALVRRIEVLDNAATQPASRRRAPATGRVGGSSPLVCLQSGHKPSHRHEARASESR